jgi:hypothetical protein
VPCRQARGQEVRRRVGRDRQGELLDIQLHQRHTHDPGIRDPDGVERDIDAARPIDHGPQMLVDGLLVQCIDHRRVGGSAGGNDVLGDRFDRCPATPGEEEPGALLREGARHSAADRSSGPVDHRDLVLQHHRSLPFCARGPTW